MTDALCSVCKQPAFTAKQADEVEEECDLKKPVTVCWDSDSEQLYVHESID